MSRKFFTGSFFKSLFIFFGLVFLLASCGSGQDPHGGAPAIPGKWLKRLNNGSWRVEMIILDHDNHERHREDAQINQETGRVQSSDFLIKTDVDYRFLAIFYYSPDGTYELPTGFVAKFVDKTSEPLNVTWEVEDIFVLNSQIPLSVLQKLPTDVVPNLDQDADGVSNFHEMIAGSDPRDQSSLPPPPRMIDPFRIVGDATNVLRIEATFEDYLGVAKITPDGSYGCGYYKWEIEDVSDGDGTKVKLKAEYNLHAHDFPQNKVSLQFKAVNALGFGEVFDFKDIHFDKSGNPDRWGPELWIKTPEPNATVSDSFAVNVEACDEDGILDITPKDVGVVEDLEATPELFAGNVDVKNMTENATELKIVATANNSEVQKYPERKNDLNAYSNSATVPVIVEAKSPIQVTPAPGTVLRDAISLTAQVDTSEIPDLMGIAITDIKSSDPQTISQFSALTNNHKYNIGSYAGIQSDLKTSYFAERETTITITYTSTTKTKTLDRVVSYKVQNSPIIEDYKVLDSGHPENPCLLGSNTSKLTWTVKNWNVPGIESGVDYITLNGAKQDNNGVWKDIVKESNAVTFSCQMDPYYFNKGKNPLTLKAVRVGLDENGVLGRHFVNEAELTYTPIEVKGLGTNAVDPTQPIQLELSPVVIGMPKQEQLDALSNLRWRVEMARVQDNMEEEPLMLKNDQKKLVSKVEGQGLEINLKDKVTLVERAQYKITISFINSNGKVYNNKDFDLYTSAPGLKGWWRFQRPGAGEYVVRSMIDPANNLIDTKEKDTFEWIGYENIDHDFITDGLKFKASASTLYDEGVEQTLPIGEQGFSFEALVRFDGDTSGFNPYAFTKRGDFALGYDAGKFVATLGFADCAAVQTNGFYTANASDNIKGFWNTEILVPIDKKWHHIMMTYDVANLILKFYVDGENSGGFLVKKIVNKECSSGFTINYHSPIVEVYSPNFWATVGEMSYYDFPLEENPVKQLCQDAYPTPVPCEKP